MAALESWWTEIAPRVAALGRPGLLYLVCEGDLVALSVERGRPTPVPCRSGRRRRLAADSALARTLRSTSARALTRTAGAPNEGPRHAVGAPNEGPRHAVGAPNGERRDAAGAWSGQLRPAVCDALLQELGAQAALLVREEGQLAAVVCVARLAGGGALETPLATVVREVEESWQRLGGERIRSELRGALTHRGAGPAWLRRIRARIFAPGPG